VIRAWLAVTLLLSLPALAQPAAYGERPEVRAFIQDLVQRHGFIEAELTYLFSRVRRADQVIEAIERPAEKNPYLARLPRALCRGAPRCRRARLLA
jgi:membrane-bound lytic murein transglycosylase B